MLESPDDDTGCDSLCLRESTYVRFTISELTQGKLQTLDAAP